jgi:ribonuclease T2
LNAPQYFAAVRQAFASVKIPPEYQAPLKNVVVSPRKLKERFLEVNRVGDASNVAVLCSGRFLQEVRVCLDKNLRPRACGSDVRDSCRVAEMIMQPVR